jgi:hypothetical protein
MKLEASAQTIQLAQPFARQTRYRAQEEWMNLGARSRMSVFVKIETTMASCVLSIVPEFAARMKYYALDIQPKMDVEELTYVK